MDKNNQTDNPVKAAEGEVFHNANQIIWDTQEMRMKPAEVLPRFKEHTKTLTLAALELIAHHTSPEEAREILEAVASHYPNPAEQPAVAS